MALSAITCLLTRLEEFFAGTEVADRLAPSLPDGLIQRLVPAFAIGILAVTPARSSDDRPRRSGRPRPPDVET